MCNLFQVQPDWARSCDSTRPQSPHAGGINVCLGDGSVRFVAVGISAATWAQACDPRDGTPLGSEQGPTFLVEETLNGRTHKVMFTPSIGGSRRWIEPMVVPEGRYYVMGDNRDNSADSRFIGLIERRRIVGRALAVAFSLDRDHWFVPRLGRFFTKLN